MLIPFKVTTCTFVLAGRIDSTKPPSPLLIPPFGLLPSCHPPHSDVVNLEDKDVSGFFLALIFFHPLPFSLLFVAPASALFPTVGSGFAFPLLANLYPPTPHKQAFAVNACRLCFRALRPSPCLRFFLCFRLPEFYSGFFDPDLPLFAKVAAQYLSTSCS